MTSYMRGYQDGAESARKDLAKLPMHAIAVDCIERGPYGYPTVTDWAKGYRDGYHLTVRTWAAANRGC